jgi:hypothetical protein
VTTTHTRTKFAVAVGAAIAGATAPALLFLGSGTAQALPELGERGTVAIIDHLPTPRGCGSCGGFNPQPDPPGFPDPGSRIGISDPEDKVGVGNPNDLPPLIMDPLITDPGSRVGIGNPDTKTGAIGDAENLPGPHVAPGQ